VRTNNGVRAACALGLFFFGLALGGCTSRDPASIAEAADRAAGGGLFRWLAAHDPSALVLVNVDAPTARAVAPDAHVRVARSIKDGCRIALAGHALLAARVAYGTQERQLADDCGYGLFRDDVTIVVAPR
jgi:hypothetical protein